MKQFTLISLYSSVTVQCVLRIRNDKILDLLMIASQKSVKSSEEQKRYLLVVWALS